MDIAHIIIEGSIVLASIAGGYYLGGKLAGLSPGRGQWGRKSASTALSKKPSESNTGKKL